MKVENDQILHTVTAGQFLGRIAAEYGVSVLQIISENPGVTPDHLTIGQILKIPKPGAGTDSMIRTSWKTAKLLLCWLKHSYQHDSRDVRELWNCQSIAVCIQLAVDCFLGVVTVRLRVYILSEKPCEHAHAMLVKCDCSTHLRAEFSNVFSMRVARSQYDICSC